MNVRNIAKIAAVFLATAAFIWIYQTPKFQAYATYKSLQFKIVLDKLALPHRLAQLSSEERDTELVIPIQGLSPRSIADSWGDPRSGNRLHEGVDMFAKKGTPVYSATYGYVVRVGTNPLGGNIVVILGAGGVGYYYAHLDSVAEGIEFGKEVSTSTIIGYVGNTGNAERTPPHLHFGMYKNGAENPFDLLVPRT